MPVSLAVWALGQSKVYTAPPPQWPTAHRPPIAIKRRAWLLKVSVTPTNIVSVAICKILYSMTCYQKDSHGHRMQRTTGTPARFPFWTECFPCFHKRQIQTPPLLCISMVLIQSLQALFPLQGRLERLPRHPRPCQADMGLGGEPASVVESTAGVTIREAGLHDVAGMVEIEELTAGFWSSSDFVVSITVHIKGT